MFFFNNSHKNMFCTSDQPEERSTISIPVTMGKQNYHLPSDANILANLLGVKIFSLNIMRIR